MKLLTKQILLMVCIAGILFSSPIVAQATIHNISIIDFAFTPANSVIAPGDTVRWTNDGIYPHTTTGDTRIWSSGVLSNGATFMHEFLTSGIYAYHCSIHVALGMRDTIRVGVTGIDEQGSSIPEKFELAQNYPNPFNAQTNIGFNLSAEGDTRLDIYDLLGQRIATLVNERLSPGSYTCIWDAGDRVSGIFYYRLSINNQAKTNRMILLK